MKGVMHMKAIRVSEYGGPSVLKLEEVPTPQAGPNQVPDAKYALIQALGGPA